MRMMAAVALGLGLALSSCGTAEEADDLPAEPIQEASDPPVELSEADLLRVCRGGAAFRNGHDVGIISARVAGADMVRVSYTRDDGKAFEYECLVEGSEVRYRMIDERGPGTGPGSWSGRGSTTTFKIEGDEIEFTDRFFDGSTDIERLKV